MEGRASRADRVWWAGETQTATHSYEGVNFCKWMGTMLVPNSLKIAKTPLKRRTCLTPGCGAPDTVKDGQNIIITNSTNKTQKASSTETILVSGANK